MQAVIGALVLAVGGAVTTISGALLAASGDSVGPWVSGGGAAAAVGGLVYVAKKFAAGELAAVNLTELVEQIVGLLRDSQAREARLHEIIEDAKEREDSLRALLLARRPGGGL